MSDKEVRMPQWLFASKGEMAMRIRSHDWSQTSLGAVEFWSSSLKTTLSILLNACVPMFLVWGGDRIVFYNDAYHILLQQHDQSLFLGQPLPPHWTTILADIEQVFATGQPLRDRPYPAALPAYTGSYSAIWEEVGIGGVLATISADTPADEQKLQQGAVALRQLEERYQTLLASIEQGFCIIEVLFDQASKPIDYRFLEVNSAFEQQTGLTDALGKRMSELAPNHEAYWFELYGKVALTGEPHRVENYAKALNRWYDVYAFPIGQRSSRKVAILFNNISDRKCAEADLRETHVQLESALAAGAIYTWRWEIPDNRVVVNAAFANLFGVDPKEAAAGLPLELFVQAMHDEDRPRVIAAINQAIETGEEYVSEYRVYTALGEQRWLAARGRVEYGVDGKPLAFPGALADITKHKQAEDALRQVSAELKRQLRKFDAITSSVSDFIYTFDLSGRFTYINQPLLDLLQKSFAEVIGKNFFELDYPTDLAARLQNQIQQVIKTHQLLKDETPYTSAAVGTRAYEYIFVPLFDANGRVEGVAGVTRDITERKQSEATAKASNERLQLLSEIANDLLLNEDSKAFLASLFAKVSRHLGLEIYFNYLFQEDQQCLQLYAYGGISEDIAKSAQFLELGQGVCGYAVQHRQPAVVENALESDYSLALPVKSLGIRAYASHPLIVGDACGGQSQRVLGTLGLGTRQRDYFTPDELDLMQAVANQVAAALERSRLVAELQERAAALVQTNRIKDEFLAVLSHELRSPLNPILGWSRLLQNGKLNSTQTKLALTTIERNAKLQSELIEDLLDISRILQGKLRLNVSPVNLATTIESAIETVRLAAEAKSIQIDAILAPDLGYVCGDPTRLQQILWNLVSNAVKFTPADGRVEVRLEQVDNQAQVSVSDNGKGITREFLPHVFDYFRQADSATTRKFGGLGLGLAIVRYLVELHGGTVEVNSPGEGLGATFRVRLPLMPIEPEVNKESASSESFLNLQGIQILVVDDDTDTREFVVFLLEQAQASVISVSSADEALAVLRQSQPDILLSDIGMPEMDGYMLIRQVRALPLDKGGGIIAIALTAYAGEFNQQQASEAGFQQHLAKPIDPDELLKVIVMLIANNKTIR